MIEICGKGEHRLRSWWTEDHEKNEESHITSCRYSYLFLREHAREAIQVIEFLREGEAEGRFA